MASSSPGQKRVSSESWLVAEEAEIWREFSSPTSDKHFCQAWLALLCAQLANIKSGVVLFRSKKEDAFLPVAVWPDISRELSFLGEVAERALREGRGVIHHPEDQSNPSFHVAYPIETSGRMMGAVVLEATKRPSAEAHALLRQLHWGVAWFHNLFYRKELRVSRKKSERIGSVMEIVATALRRGRLQQVLFDIANHIAQHLKCTRVSIGLVSGQSVRVAALSNSAWFEKNAITTRLYKSAMLDVADEMEPIFFVDKAVDKETDTETDVKTSNKTELLARKDSAHARLAQESGSKSILSIPLLAGVECVAVMTLEKETSVGFTEKERRWLDTLAILLAAVIEQKKMAERGYFAKFKDDLHSLMQRLFGPRHLVWKFGTASVLALVLALTFIDINYRVTAKTVIEGEVQLAAVAPFDGFIESSYVRAGDTVVEGQVLCRLDDSNLKLELNKWASERDQYDRKLREAIANRKRSDMQVLIAQLRQAEAQYALVKYRLDHLAVTAPFDGIVISGDLSQLIGSPVELGKELFEITPLDAYRIILQVDESEMRHLQPQQRGKLLISGIVGEPMPFSVSKITAMATAKDGRNFFRVEAKLDASDADLRPGMEGVGKVDVGQRKLWWVLTHSFTDWLRISLWRWLP